MAQDAEREASHRGYDIMRERGPGGVYYQVRFHTGKEDFESVREARQYIDFILDERASRSAR